MRLLVCGDRNWTDYEAVLSELERLRPDVVIEGEARGADSMARTAAYAIGIPVVAFPANWSAEGRAAGPIRNRRMLVEGKPDMVLAFHDDLSNSKGTKNMVEIARKAGIKVVVWSHKVQP